MSGNEKLCPAAKSFGVVALGEVLVDFTQAGRSASGMRLFEQNPGGAPANLLCAAARLGAKTAFIGKVGKDMHGRFLKSALDDAGIDTRALVEAEDVFTTLAFVALNGGEREFSFARKPGADTRLTPDEVDYALVSAATIFHFGSLSLTDEPARSATRAALSRAGETNAIISYDPNYRAALWSGSDEAVEQMRAPLRCVDALKLSQEEAAMLSGFSEPERAALSFAELGIPLTAITLGRDGALLCCGGAIRAVAGYSAEVVDTTGAGDAFWGAFLFKLLTAGRNPRSLTIDEAVSFARFGNAAAAICVSRRGGMPSMPTMQEVQTLINSD